MEPKRLALTYSQPSERNAHATFRPGPGLFPPVPVHPGLPPTLTVVVDTEEEFDWSGPFDSANVSVANVAEQHLAQAIFRAHGVVPTYVVDYPVAASQAAVAALRAFADAGECQIGAHLHPWVTPPAAQPVDSRHSYPGNLAPADERAKLTVLTDTITEAFGNRPIVYKAGRYGLGPATAATLRALGYRVDVSLAPYTNFSADGGPDFSVIRESPVRLGPGILGLPLSVGFAGSLAPYAAALYPATAGRVAMALRLPGVAARLGLIERMRLSPEEHSCTDMLRQVRSGLDAGIRLFMLTYHSSSLLPGATPYVRDIAERAKMLQTLDRFLGVFLGELGGQASTVAALAEQIERASA